MARGNEVRIPVRVDRRDAERDIEALKEELRGLEDDATVSPRAGGGGAPRARGGAVGAALARPRGGGFGVGNAASVAAGGLAAAGIEKLIGVVTNLASRIPGVGELKAAFTAGEAAETRVKAIAGAAAAAGSPLSDKKIEQLLQKLIEVEERRGRGEARVATLRVPVEAARIRRAFAGR